MRMGVANILVLSMHATTTLKQQQTSKCSTAVAESNDLHTQTRTNDAAPPAKTNGNASSVSTQTPTGPKSFKTQLPFENAQKQQLQFKDESENDV